MLKHALKRVLSFLIPIFTIIMLIFANKIAYHLIGFFNIVFSTIFNLFKRMICLIFCSQLDYDKDKRIIHTIAMVYGANQEKRRLFMFDWFASLLKLSKWIPVPINVFYLNGRIGLVFAISALEDQLRKKDELEKLLDQLIQAKFEEDREKLSYEYASAVNDVRCMLETVNTLTQVVKKTRAREVRFAGIYPGRLDSYGVQREPIEKETTVVAVEQAIKKVRAKYEKHGMKKDTPIILIGGGGYIGQSLEERIVDRDQCMVITIDLDNRYQFRELTDYYDLRDKPAILVNLANPKAIDPMIEDLWKEVYVLNEVYPMFNWKTIEKLKQADIKAGHIVGAKGFMLFSLGRGYWHKVPCCLAHVGERFEIVIRELTLYDKKSRDF